MISATGFPEDPLVVTRSAAELYADIVIRARKAGLIVVVPDGGTASELVFSRYDGVLLEEDSPRRRYV